MSFKQRILNVLDNAESKQIIPLINNLDLKDECEKCAYFNFKAEESYRCACLGSCIGVTLNDELNALLLYRLGLITQEEKVTVAFKGTPYEKAKKSLDAKMFSEAWSIYEKLIDAHEDMLRAGAVELSYLMEKAIATPLEFRKKFMEHVGKSSNHYMVNFFGK